MMTIVEHVQAGDGLARLVVRVPDTDPLRLASIAGDATPELDPDTGEPTGATLLTVEWGADVDPATQLAETRALIAHALATAAVPVPAPEPITPPGTQL